MEKPQWHNKEHFKWFVICTYYWMHASKLVMLALLLTSCQCQFPHMFYFRCIYVHIYNSGRDISMQRLEIQLCVVFYILLAGFLHLITYFWNMHTNVWEVYAISILSIMMQLSTTSDKDTDLGIGNVTIRRKKNPG